MWFYRTKIRFWGILAVLLVPLSACRGSAQPSTPTQLDPAFVLTAAARTAQAMLTAQAASTPSPLPATPAPVETALLETVSPTSPVSPTLNLTPVAGSGGTDKAEFVTDVSVVDGTVFRPGDAFVKTWRLKNTGTSTWTSAYSVVYVSGAQMGKRQIFP